MIRIILQMHCFLIFDNISPMSYTKEFSYLKLVFNFSSFEEKNVILKYYLFSIKSRKRKFIYLKKTFDPINVLVDKTKIMISKKYFFSFKIIKLV